MQLKKIPILLISSLAIIYLAGCQSKPSDESEDTSASELSAETKIPADFEVFYKQFHNDTAFQLAHIIFPLSGLPANADTLQDPNFKWQRETWKFHKAIDENLTGYEQSWQVLNEEMITETIVQTSVGIGMVRRFAKVSDEWNLIYYAGMNQMKQ